MQQKTLESHSKPELFNSHPLQPSWSNRQCFTDRQPQKAPRTDYGMLLCCLMLRCRLVYVTNMALSHSNTKLNKEQTSLCGKWWSSCHTEMLKLILNSRGWYMKKVLTVTETEAGRQLKDNTNVWVPFIHQSGISYQFKDKLISLFWKRFE